MADPADSTEGSGLLGPGLLPRELEAAAARMRGFPAPWCVAGGWALDLFLGRVTRPHADVDLALFREDQARLREHLAGWSFRKAVGGARVEWPAGERLRPPVHEIHARSPHDPSATLEFLLNERDGGRWLFRRDPAVTCPADRVMVDSGAGVPVLCPAVVLLYKAKAPREVDERDFRAVRGALDPERRAWLRAALERCHPGHAWIGKL